MERQGLKQRLGREVFMLNIKVRRPITFSTAKSTQNLNKQMCKAHSQCRMSMLARLREHRWDGSALTDAQRKHT